MDPIKIENSLESLIKLIDEQPALPKNLDKILLVRYLKASDYDAEKAKNLLQNSLKWRHKYPHIFTQRDPFSKEMQRVIEYA